MALWTTEALHRHGGASSQTTDRTCVSSRRGSGDAHDDVDYPTHSDENTNKKTCSSYTNFNADHEKCSCINLNKRVVKYPKRTFKLNKFVKSMRLNYLGIYFLFIGLSSFLFSTTVAESQRTPLSEKPFTNFISLNNRVSSRWTNEKVRAKGDVGLLFHHHKRQSRVKRGLHKNPASVENKNASNDTGKHRESRGLTWGEFIAKSSEAPAHHLYASTEVPFNDRNYSQENDNAEPQEARSFQYTKTVPNNQHYTYGRTSQKLDVHSRRLDLYDKSPTSEFMNPNVVTSSPPIDGEILDKLAHYLLYGSEETKKAFSGDSVSIGDRDSPKGFDYDQGSEVDTVNYVNDNTDRKDNSEMYFYDDNSPSFQYSNPSKNSNNKWDHPVQNENNPIQTSTETIDMKKIFQDLADLIEILPDHFEELDEEEIDRTGSSTSDPAMSTRIDTVHLDHKHKNIEQSYGQGFSQQSELSSFASENIKDKKVEKADGFLSHLLRNQTERVDSSTKRPLFVPSWKVDSQSRLGTEDTSTPAPKASNFITTMIPGSPQYVRDLQTFFRTSSLSPMAENLGQVVSTTKSPFYKIFEHKASSTQPPTTDRPFYKMLSSTVGYPLPTSSNFDNAQKYVQTTARPFIYSSIENIREHLRTSTRSPIEKVSYRKIPHQSQKVLAQNASVLVTEKSSLERVSATQSPYRSDSLSNPVSRESAVYDYATPLIFTSRPIFISNSMDEEGTSSTQRPNSQLPFSWTTESTFSSVESITQQLSKEQVLLNSPHQPLIVNSKHLNSSLEPETMNSTDGKDEKIAQKRTLDLLYHMFVDPTTDENGNRRNTLLEDVIKAIDNHIIGDVVALKEHSQSGKKGQSHFKENNGDFFKTLLESIGFDEPFMKSTVDAFSSMSSPTSGRERNVPRKLTSARQPSGTRHNTASSSKDFSQSIQQARPQIRNSSPEIIPSESNIRESSVHVVGEPHVETLPSGDEFLLTDEFGQQQIVTIDDIVSSLTDLDEAELSELLGANRRSDQDVERVIDRESAENQALPKSPNAGLKINNLIVVGHNGQSEVIPFDQIAMDSQDTLLPTTTPPSIMIAAQHLLGNRVSEEKVENNPTVQAAQHLFGFNTGSQLTPKHSNEHYEESVKPASRPIYTKAPLQGRVIVSIPSQTAAAENPMIAINHKSNLNAYDQVRNRDSTLRTHSIPGVVDSSAQSQKAEVQRDAYDSLSEVQHQPARSQRPLLPFDPQNKQEALQKLKYSLSHEINLQGQDPMNALPSQLEAQEELQLKKKLALDIKLRTQLEQLQRIQNQLSSQDEPLPETISEASVAARPVNSHMIPRERIIDVNPDQMNLQPEAVRKVAITSIPLQETIGEAAIDSMLKDKEFISSSNEMNSIFLKAISHLPSSEVGNGRQETSTFRTPTPLISEDLHVVKKNKHASFIKSGHKFNQDDYRPHITVVENKKNLESNYGQYFSQANTHQYPSQLKLDPRLQMTNLRQASISASTLSLPHEQHSQQPPGSSKAHVNSHAHFHVPEISNSNSDLLYSYEDRSSSDLYYEPHYQNIRNDDYLDVSSYGTNEFGKQIVEQQVKDEHREKFASKIYEQVVKSLPKPIHFEPTTTAPPVEQKSQIFGFNLPNIFPSSHSHTHSIPEKAVEKKSDDEKDELKWNDPLGLLGLYDYLPFSRTRKEEKKSVVKVTTPKPVSPEKRLQHALEIGNVPPHVSKILVNQLKSNSDGMRSSEFSQPADRRQFDRVPQVRYRNVPNSRSYSIGPQVFHPRKKFSPQQRIRGSSRSYPPPLFRARKFGPPNPGSLAPGSVVRNAAAVQSHGLPRYASAQSTHSARPQSSHFGVFSSEKEHEEVSAYEHAHDYSHVNEYSSVEIDHHSGSYGEDDDHEHHDSPEYDTYLVPLGTKTYKKVQPLIDLSLLVHNVKVKQVGDINESFSFPKVGDPSKFVNIYRPPPHYRR
ncbi:hypothetical protein FHG87_009609 [Trinorchestia longiramus]|nr:hypothetical protein FHG87_009609 [Trinorchestia longiramus]